PSMVGAPPETPGLAEQVGAVNAELRRWMQSSDSTTSPPELPEDVIVAAVTGDVRGCLALISADDGPLLVTDVGCGFETGAAAIQRAVLTADSLDVAVDDIRAERTLRQLREWIAARRGASTIDFQAASAARLRRAALA